MVFPVARSQKWMRVNTSTDCDRIHQNVIWFDPVHDVEDPSGDLEDIIKMIHVDRFKRIYLR